MISDPENRYSRAAASERRQLHPRYHPVEMSKRRTERARSNTAAKRREGIYVGNVLLLQSPFVDLRNLWPDKWTAPPRSLWIWIATCVALLAWAIYTDGFWAHLALRANLFLGAGRVVNEARNKRRGRGIKDQQVSLGCFLSILALMIFLAFTIGGLILLIVDD